MKTNSLIKILILLTFTIVFCSCRLNKTIKWWSSSEHKVWDEQRNLFWQPLNISDKNFDYEIFPDSVKQEIDGFGGCFNEMGWSALQLLQEPQKSNVIRDLFNEKGLNLNIGRVPIGANDFSYGYYSLDDSINDYSMEYFSIERDKKYLIPYIKLACKYQSHLNLWASPWTPPSWMKNNNHYACEPGVGNKLRRGLKGKEGVNQFVMNDSTLTAYSKYFVKFVKAYKDEGIQIKAIQPQNEFNSCQVFPSCVWTPSALSQFIGNYLGPRFEKNKIKTEIWFGTIERPNIANIDTVLSNDKCQKYIKGLGFQWGGREAVNESHKKYPEMRIMQTENECGDGSNDWKAAERTFKLMKYYFDAGANSYMYWNLILDKNSTSFWGWKQNALITIDTRKKKYSLNPEYFVFKHFSHFITPGSKLVKSDGNNILSFLTPDDELVIVIYNPDKDSHIVTLKVGNNKLEIKLQGETFNTLFCYNIN